MSEAREQVCGVPEARGTHRQGQEGDAGRKTRLGLPRRAFDPGRQVRDSTLGGSKTRETPEG